MKKIFSLLLIIFMMVFFTSCKTDIGYATLVYTNEKGETKEISVAGSTNEEFIAEVITAINYIKPKNYDYNIISRLNCSLQGTFHSINNDDINISFLYSSSDTTIFNQSENLLHGNCYYSYEITNNDTNSLIDSKIRSLLYYQYPDETYLNKDDFKQIVENSDDILYNNLFYSTIADELFNTLNVDMIKSNNLYISDTTKSTIKFHYSYTDEDNNLIRCFITVKANTGLVSEILIMDNNYASVKIKEVYSHGKGVISNIIASSASIKITCLYENVPQIGLSNDQKSEYN